MARLSEPAIAAGPGRADPGLKAALARSNRARRVNAALLVAPLFVFLVISFVVPISLMLFRSIDNPEVVDALPRTAAALRAWDGAGLPGEAAFAALGADLMEAREARTIAAAARRLNYEISGFRSTVMRTGRKLRPAAGGESWRDILIAADPNWGDPAYWAALRRAAVPITAFYLLAAIDREVDDTGAIVQAPPERTLYVDIFLRTLWMSGVVMAVCIVLGYPVAFLLATVPTRIGNVLMILVLLPFWTSLLVRTSAWVVLLQREGLVNGALGWLGLTGEPIQLVFNRPGVYIAMVHVLLPFMILPLYSVMKGIPPSLMRAAASLGANPFIAFVRVYLPQTMPGVGAGCLLVFILAVGYYITPALLGGPQDQMVSYFVAYFTNQTVNWGMGSALGVVLFGCTLILYALYSRLVGVDRMRLG